MYKNFNLTDEERKEILESHKSHGYKKPINEVIRDKEYDVARGIPDFKTQTGKPVGDYVSNRDAARQFQQDFQKEFPDSGKEYTPHWEKDRPNSLGDHIDDLTPPIRFNKSDRPNVVDEPKAPDVFQKYQKLVKKEELDSLERKIIALRKYKQDFGLDERMTQIYNDLLIKYREESTDFDGGDVK